jgi:hypothetical protein
MDLYGHQVFLHGQRVSNLLCFNPKPHGRGRICPHFFQRPITQKSLSAKNQRKIYISQKTSAASKSWVMYPSKNINLCLFYASEQAKVIKKATWCVYHLSRPPHFCPHQGGGVGWQSGEGGKPLNRAKVCSQQQCGRFFAEPIVSLTDLLAFFCLK